MQAGAAAILAVLATRVIQQGHHDQLKLKSEDSSAPTSAARNFDPVEATRLHQAALEHYDKGNWNRALPLLYESIQQNPLEPQPYYHLASVHQKLGRFSDAVAVYR